MVSTARLCPSAKLHLEVRASATALTEYQSYDMAAVRIRILDGNGTPAPYAQLPVKLKLEGDAELVGPDVVTAEGGMTGTYIRTLGRTGKATLTVEAWGLESVTVDFTVTRNL